MPTAKPSSTKPTPSGGSKLPIVFLLLTVLMLAAGGYYVYGMFTGGSMPGLKMPEQLTQLTGKGMMRVSESDFKDIDDPLIRKHLAAQINIGKYRIRSTSSGMDGEQLMELVMSGEEVHYHMVQSAGGKEMVNMITIGDTTYLKDQKDGKWWKQVAKPETESTKTEEMQDTFKPADFKEEYTKNVGVEYKSLGEESCGSLTCHKYEEITSSSPEGKRTFWFDTKELLLRKEVHGFGEFQSTMEYSYDNLSIKAPSPTKDVPEGKSVYDYMVTGMMGEDASQEYEAAKKMMEQYQSEDYSMPEGYDELPPEDY